MTSFIPIAGGDHLSEPVARNTETLTLSGTEDRSTVRTSSLYRHSGDETEQKSRDILANDIPAAPTSAFTSPEIQGL